MEIRSKKYKEELFSNGFGNYNEEISLKNNEDKELINYNSLKE
ncbi:hypothetical protein QIA41_05025 (plasmid) [Borreliella sinica]